MKNLKKLFGIISIIAIIACVMAACDSLGSDLGSGSSDYKPGDPNPSPTNPTNPPNQTTVAVTSVSIKSTTSLVVGGTETLYAAIDPPIATNQNVTWNSGNVSVATVSASGTVTAVAAGTATITVTTADGDKTASCTVNVSTSAVAVTGVSLNKQSTSLNVGDVETLVPAVTPSNATNQNLTWTSSNASAATVSSGGRVTAVTAGTATITVTTVDGNKTATCSVTVTAKTTPPVSTIPTFDNAYALGTWLDEQPTNTVNTAYEVAYIGVLDRALMFSSRRNKYVSLDLSGNTYTSIGSETFEDWTNLTDVTIGNSITSIGDFAFARCANLKNITIPNNVSRIGGLAFFSSGLKSVTIPDSVTYIVGTAFASCKSLTAVNVDFGNEVYTSENGVLYANDKSIIWCYPAGKTGSFTIPNSVTKINTGAFYGCTGLTGITIPDSVKSIMCEAFRDCTSLASVTIPNNVRDIQERAFSGCTSLTTVTIPQSVLIIEYGAFSKCTSLTSINVLPNNHGGFYSENGILYWKGINEKGDKIFSLDLYPAGKKDSTFTIPDGVTYIYYYAFSGCESLTGVKIPDSVTIIGGNAFENSGLTSVTIPASINKIEDQAFGWCSDLTSVTFVGMIASNNFGNTSLGNNFTFPGDLVAKYLAGGPGTYTRATTGMSGTWTKQ